MNNNRQNLIDLASGKRPGYWVEILHNATTGQEGYLLHRPSDKDQDTRRPLTCNLEALRIFAAWDTGQEDAADKLQRYDDGRTYEGDLVEASTAKALTKWASK